MQIEKIKKKNHNNQMPNISILGINVVSLKCYKDIWLTVFLQNELALKKKNPTVTPVFHRFLLFLQQKKNSMA